MVSSTYVTYTMYLNVSSTLGELSLSHPYLLVFLHHCRTFGRRSSSWHYCVVLYDILSLSLAPYS
jgi:hypothetical protein